MKSEMIMGEGIVSMLREISKQLYYIANDVLEVENEDYDDQEKIAFKGSDSKQNYDKAVKEAEDIYHKKCALLKDAKKEAIKKAKIEEEEFADLYHEFQLGKIEREMNTKLDEYEEEFAKAMEHARKRYYKRTYIVG